jgi:hypothetical protein
MPYLSESFEGGMRASMDGNNYLAWTSKTNAGIDCRMGFGIDAGKYLQLKDMWKSEIYNLVDKNLFDMPKKIEFVSPENGKKLKVGESVDVSFYVTFLNNITKKYFPCTGGLVNFVTDGETDKTVAISDLNGRVTVKWIPKRKGNVLTAKIVDKDGKTISEATFTPVVEEDDGNYTFTVDIENGASYRNKIDVVKLVIYSDNEEDREYGFYPAIASSPYNNGRFTLNLPSNLAGKYLTNIINENITISNPDAKVTRGGHLYAYKSHTDIETGIETDIEVGVINHGSGTWVVYPTYADKYVSGTGSYIEEFYPDGVKYTIKTTVNEHLKKGWNMVYHKHTINPNNFYEEWEFTTEPPAGAKWYFIDTSSE